MSTLVSRGYTQADADAFMARASGTHTVKWKANAYRFTGSSGATTLMWENIPIVGGSLTLDSSDPTRRRLQLEVAAGDLLIPTNADHPLVPYGQFIVLWCTIDRLTGGDFPWIKCGEFPVVSYISELPSRVATIECTDWSGRVEEYLHLGKTSYKGKKVKTAIVDMCQAAVPNKGFGIGVQASAVADVKHVTNYIADAETGRWTACTAVADAEGLEIFFNANGDLIIRDQITPAEDDVVVQEGPDIGTVSNPVAVIAEGSNLVGITASLTREGGANLVRINLSGTRTRKLKKQNKKKKGVETKAVQWNGHSQALVTSGPARWGDVFGYLPVVRSKQIKGTHKKDEGTVGWSGEDEERAYNRVAANLLQRRRGVIRYLDLDAAGCYWVEPDDKVRIVYGGVTEYHYVQSISFDISGKSAARMRTRQLAVTDPGEGA